MKRSQVLKLIERLYNLEIENYPKENPADIFAENLLCHLEQLGMLPPICFKLKENLQVKEVDMKNKSITFETATPSLMSVNEWEEDNA